MAASITHLVIGEKTFAGVPYLNRSPRVYGAFLMGCILVDVHVFHPIDRRVTHFVGRVDEDGKAAYQSSCVNFLNQLGKLIRCPWPKLDVTEQAFVAGYLCHLAVDEDWKRQGKQLFENLNITSWLELPVPADVSLTTLDYLTYPLLVDPGAIKELLAITPIPDVFSHVSHETFQSQWQIIRDYLFSGGTGEAHLTMLEKAGKPLSEIQTARQMYLKYWEEALAFTRSQRIMGGVESYLQQAASLVLKVLPALAGQANEPT